MKIIKVRSCGVCPHNRVNYGPATDNFVDFCDLIMKCVNPNVIDEDCILEDLKE